MSLNKKVIVTSFVGTTLEYYDFALYAAFLPFIANYFFPEIYKNELTLLTYGTPFFTRPFGATLFGIIGDKFGRKKALVAPLILMSIFTLLVVLTPSYSQIGLTATIVIILCRLGQGFCLGAEFGGALVFSLEHHKKALGLVAGLLGSAVILGSLCANIVSYIFTLSAFDQAFWRVPFIIGSLVGIVGVCARYELQESPEFVPQNAPRAPFPAVLKQYPLSVLQAAAVAGLNGLLGSFIFVYINFFLVNDLLTYTT